LILYNYLEIQHKQGYAGIKGCSGSFFISPFFEECDYVEIITFINGNHNLDIERDGAGRTVRRHLPGGHRSRRPGRQRLAEQRSAAPGDRR
jgi:YD repeat-containing protein